MDNCFIKNAPKYRKLDETKSKNAPKITRLLNLFAEHGIMTHITMMAKPMKTLELHYPMIQFLITEII